MIPRLPAICPEGGARKHGEIRSQGPSSCLFFLLLFLPLGRGEKGEIYIGRLYVREQGVGVEKGRKRGVIEGEPPLYPWNQSGPWKREGGVRREGRGARGERGRAEEKRKRAESKATVRERPAERRAERSSVSGKN